MVKRQTPRSQGRRRPQPVATPAGVSAETIPPSEELGAEEAATQTSPAALMTAIEAPSAGTAAHEELLADEVSTEALDPIADAHPQAAIEPGTPDGNADQPAAASGPTARSIDVPVVVAAQTHRRASLVPADLASAGATLQAFLLNEGLAAFAHWRALATVRSPAEAVRLHVDEMQRAAEASLTCMNRIVGHLGRSAAAA